MGGYTSAHQRQLDSLCDCCDADPRAIAAEAAEARAEVGLVPHANAATEWAGITRRDDAVSESLAEVRRLNQALGPDWADGLPF